jgi:hypothetical protein
MVYFPTKIPKMDTDENKFYGHLEYLADILDIL